MTLIFLTNFVQRKNVWKREELTNKLLKETLGRLLKLIFKYLTYQLRNDRNNVIVFL